MYLCISLHEPPAPAACSGASPQPQWHPARAFAIGDCSISRTAFFVTLSAAGSTPAPSSEVMHLHADDQYSCSWTMLFASTLDSARADDSHATPVNRISRPITEEIQIYVKNW